MFVPLEPARWPEAHEVRDLRISLNAPVLLGHSEPSDPPVRLGHSERSDPVRLGHSERARATRAAVGWLPADGERAAVRLWLRSERDARPTVRAFELEARPLGPSARAHALETAERFLAGLGFLFPEPGSAEAAFELRNPEADGDPRSPEADGDPRSPHASFGPRGAHPTPDPRGAAPEPASGPARLAASTRTAIRGDGPLSKFHARGRPGRAQPSTSSRGLLDRLARSLGARQGGSEA